MISSTCSVKFVHCNQHHHIASICACAICCVQPTSSHSPHVCLHSTSLPGKSLDFPVVFYECGGALTIIMKESFHPSWGGWLLNTIRSNPQHAKDTWNSFNWFNINPQCLTAAQVFIGDRACDFQWMTASYTSRQGDEIDLVIGAPNQQLLRNAAMVVATYWEYRMDSAIADDTATYHGATEFWNDVFCLPYAIVPGLNYTYSYTCKRASCVYHSD